MEIIVDHITIRWNRPPWNKWSILVDEHWGDLSVPYGGCQCKSGVYFEEFDPKLSDSELIEKAIPLVMADDKDRKPFLASIIKIDRSEMEAS